MDLREKKTRKSIQDAFLTLRAHKPVERITVRELTELAQVSKSTFYLHYRDIYDLSEEIERQLIREILDQVRRSEDLLETAPQFTADLIRTFHQFQPQINVVFSDSRAAVLPESIERELKEYFFSVYPEKRQDIQFNVWLTYQIQGSFYAYIRNGKEFGYENIACFLEAASQKLKELRPEEYTNEPKKQEEL